MLTAYTASTSTRGADLTFTGDVDAAGHRISFTGAGEASFATKEASLTFSATGIGSFQIREVLPDFYLQIPHKDAGRLPSGKSWIEIDLNTVLKSRFGTSLSQLEGSAQSPTQTLAYLQQASDGVRKVGTATIGGVATTEYAADVDLAKAAAAKAPQARAAIQKIEAELHTSVLPVHVWIDGSHLVRQMTYGFDFTVQGQHVATNFTLDLSHYGVPVHVTAPPASETINASQLDAAAGTA